MISKTKRVMSLIFAGAVAAASLTGCTTGSVPVASTVPDNFEIPVRSSVPDSSETSVTSSVPDSSETSVTSSTVSDSSETPATSSQTSEESYVPDPDPVTQKLKDAMASEAERNGGIVELRMWCSVDDRDFELNLVEKFKEKYEDSRYELKITQRTFGEDISGRKIIDAPQDGADVFNFTDDQLSMLVESKTIATVGDLYYQNVIKNNSSDSVEVCSVDGTAYAFPKSSYNGCLMYYDKRVYTDPSMVENMDSMIETADKAGKDVFFPLSNSWYNTGFFLAAGCELKLENGVQTAAYDTTEGLNAAKAMCHISEKDGEGFKGKAGPEGENAVVQQGFSEGTMAAAVTGTWMGPAIKKAIGEENVGVAKLPTVLMDGKQVQLRSFGGYQLVGVNAFTKFPIASQALAYFLTNPENQIRRYEARGLIPTSTEALATDRIKSDPALQAIEAQREFAHPQYSSVGGIYWASDIGGFGLDIVTNKGALSDAELENSLREIVAQLK